MTHQLDDKDQKILELLQENSAYSTRDITKKTLIPITTVHKRITKLKQLGIIKKFTVEIDHSKIDKALGAVILASLNYDILKKNNITEKDVAKKLKSWNTIEKTYHVTGMTDIILIVRVKDTNELEIFLDQLKKKFNEIDKTQTSVILSEL